MKKILITTILLTSLLFSGFSAKAGTNAKQDILKLTPGMSIEEIDKAIKEASNSLGKSEVEITSQILNELKVQKNLTEKERLNNKSISTRGKGDGATYTLGAAKYSGDVFYEPASTFSVQHGHVGIYWTSDIIVESMPATDGNPTNGVRSLNRINKKVEGGSYIFTFSGVSKDIQNRASNWAYGRRGEKYSYNFATNRLTSYYGDKNCSKLVWSAYMVEANLDLDQNGGLGVYPKDILNHSKSSIYKSY
ncbi:hypothetical protein [Clostridium polynesiense]|uniref:hypothetical protein n=1 Tax=Clostridium polynesiense TaxID=1325933 RepID=UPI00058F832F|nr:hypothetical protein [Clostridium polynesiense]